MLYLGREEMAICLTVGQKGGQRFTVDVKKYAIEHIIPQLVALPVYFYKVALASLWAGAWKVSNITEL